MYRKIQGWISKYKDGQKDTRMDRKIQGRIER